jgi:hypothetical protein
MKRDPKSDVPRRIYKSTIDRIDRHIKISETQPDGTRKKVKKDFNKFLELVLDTYENLLNAKPYYAIELFEEVEEARGKLIIKAAKEKIPLEQMDEPKTVVVLE